MDSFMGKLQFGDESPKMPPSPGTRPGQLSPNNSIDGNSNAFSLEFGNGEFSGAELKKIMANEKLAEIALTDPKRAKRYGIFIRYGFNMVNWINNQEAFFLHSINFTGCLI